MDKDETEAIKACYDSWAVTYHDEYLGPKAGYPPVHIELVRTIVRGHGCRILLDAGCGPASMVRALVSDVDHIFGFDLSQGMIDEARRIASGHGMSADNLWVGDARDPSAYVDPRGTAPSSFDGLLSIGVLPHISDDDQGRVLSNSFAALRPGGIALFQARNELFSLFTFNRYSRDFFFEKLVSPEIHERAKAGDAEVQGALKELDSFFRTDLPRRRIGVGKTPGYDEIRSRLHNPFTLCQAAEAAGFRDVRPHFYNFCCLPPMFAARFPAVFQSASLALEDPESWTGYFMAPAFIVSGIRP